MEKNHIFRNKLKMSKIKKCKSFHHFDERSKIYKKNMKNYSQRDPKKFLVRFHLKTLHEFFLLTPIMLCMCLQDQQA
jgi:hypothetical protein